MLEALGGARAVFFMVGEQVERHPSVAAAVAAAGHEIGLHGYRHHNQMRVPPWRLADDLRRGAKAIADATGRAPALYRPPRDLTPAAWRSPRRLHFSCGRGGARRARPHDAEEIARLATRA